MPFPNYADRRRKKTSATALSMVSKCPGEPTKFGDKGRLSRQTVTGPAITRLSYQRGLVAMRHCVSSAVSLVYSGCPGKVASEVAVPPPAYRGVVSTNKQTNKQTACGMPVPLELTNGHGRVAGDRCAAFGSVLWAPARHFCEAWAPSD